MAYNYPQELVFIAKLSPSAAANASFTTGISTNFTNYLIKVRDFIASVEYSLQLTMSTNGGTSYLSSGYKSKAITQSGSLDSDSSTAHIVFLNDNSITSTEPCNADITLYNLSNAQVKTVYAFGSCLAPSDGFETSFCCGVQTGTTAVNAIRIQPNSGTITGNLYLYGII